MSVPINESAGSNCLHGAESEQSLDEIMSKISRSAQRRGLTPDVLKSILDEGGARGDRTARFQSRADSCQTCSSLSRSPGNTGSPETLAGAIRRSASDPGR